MSKESRVCYYLVAYIDVLGQKEVLAKLKEFPETAEEKDVFIQAIMDSYHFVKKFRDSFNEFFDGFTTQTSPESSSEKEMALAEMKKAKVETQVISDTVIMYSPLSDEDIKCPASGIYQILGSVASTFLLSLAIEKKACRGGIEIGPSIEMEQGDIYGYALCEAHRIENKVAEYPRIVIGGELVQYLSLSKNSGIADVFNVFNGKMSAVCLELISRDSDGQYILDYLGEGFKKYIGDGKATKDNVLQAYKFVNQELDKFGEKGNTKLATRYARLKDYFDKNIVRWNGQKEN